MFINKENIEAYLLDYHEGNLDINDEKALEAFLKAHPEYRSLLDNEPLPVLEPNPFIAYPNKEALKRKPGEAIFFPRIHVLRIGIAAAIIGSLLTITLPFLKQENIENSGTMRAHAKRPSLVLDTQQITPTPSNQMEEQAPAPMHHPVQPAPAAPVQTVPNSPVLPLSTLVAQKTTELPEPLQGKSIDRLVLDQFISDERQMITQLAKAGNRLIPTAEPDKNTNLGAIFVTILNNEVARDFLPETIQQELPEPQQEPKNQPKRSLILEVPPVGKKIIDTFLKSE